MAAKRATYALAAAMELTFLPNCCEGSHILALVVIFEPSFVMHTIMPIS